MRARGSLLAAVAVFYVGGMFAPSIAAARRDAIDNPPAPLPIIRGGVTPARPDVAKLTFKVTPIRCIGACMVTLKAIVEAPPDLCVTGVRWIYDRDGCRTATNTKGCYREYETECSERRFSMAHRYEVGRYFVSVEILSDDTSLPAKGMYIDVDQRGGE